jgi:hypothetical protein
MKYRSFVPALTVLASVWVPVHSWANLDIAWDSDAVCVGRITSVEGGVSVSLTSKESANPLETIQCALLHVAVEGTLIGDLPREITVLASERALRRWGWTSEPLKAPEGGGALAATKQKVRVGVGAAVPELESLVGFHGLIQLEKARPDGGFYRNSRDRLREGLHDIDPKYAAVGIAHFDGASYALHSFDYEGSTPLYATPATRFDSSLPPGLRLLDFLASDALSGDLFKPESLKELWTWNPLDYRVMHDKTWLSNLSVSSIQTWFSGRFADANLTSAQRADQDMLCLRADWGDPAAYARFRAVTIRLGKPAKWTWLPRQSDSDLLLYLAVRSRSGEIVRAIFAQLEQHPEAKAKILAASARLLGKSWIADQGILECLYKLTGNPALNPSDEKGMKTDISACVQAARQELRKCGVE